MADHHDTRRIVARYPGECADCGHRFMPGIEIGYRDGEGELCCGYCLDNPDLDDAIPTCAPCPACRLTHAGECF